MLSEEEVAQQADDPIDRVYLIVGEEEDLVHSLLGRLFQVADQREHELVVEEDVE